MINVNIVTMNEVVKHGCCMILHLQLQLIERMLLLIRHNRFMHVVNGNLKSAAVHERSHKKRVHDLVVYS